MRTIIYRLISAVNNLAVNIMIKFFTASNKPLDLFRCILKNDYIAKHPKTISVNDDSRGLPERNNEFIGHALDSGEECWLVFCHDDVIFLEDISVKIESLPKNKIYGLCGVKKINGVGEIVGRIMQPSKTEENEFVTLGREVDGHETVATFDSLCTIVHSSLFEYSCPLKYAHGLGDLRFDENLMYHMHVEEFSINALENFDIKSAVVQIDCLHLSWGSKNEYYYKAVEYVKNKHNLESFICTCDKRALDNYEDDQGWKKCVI